ncbi:MAG: DUF5687 family protein [Bacteroidota bacterium]
MLLRLTRLQALAFRRAPYLWGRIALAVAKGAGALYAIGSALIIGFVWPDLVGAVAPEADALGLVEMAFVPALAGLLGLRFVFQDVPTRGASAFLLLPVSRQRVASGVLVRSLPNPLNVAPLAFAVPFAARAVRLEAGPQASWAVGLAAVLLIGLSHALFVVWKTQRGARPLATTLGVGTVTALVAVVEWQSGSLLATVRGGALWPLAGLLILLGGASVAAYRGLVASLYLDHTSRRKVDTASGAQGFARGGVRDWLDVDVALMRRTTFPRGIVVNAVLVSIGMTIGVLVVDVGLPGTFVLVFSTGALAGSLGQYALPFASGHWDRLLTLPGGVERFVRSKVLGVAAGTLAIGAAQLVPVLILAPEAAAYIGVSVLFSLGVLAPAALFGSTLGPKPIDVSERLMFNYKVQSFGAQALVASTALVAGIPIALAGPAWGAAVAAAMGACGLALSPVWVQALLRRIRRRRHALASRFRGVL